MTDYPAMHGPSRPDWNCLVCGEPWPCLTRKRQLKELCQCNVRTLVHYMSEYLRDAHQEIDGMSTAEITERFVGWCSKPLEMWATQEHEIKPVKRREQVHQRGGWKMIDQDRGLMPSRMLTVDPVPPVLTSGAAQDSSVSFSMEQLTEVRIETPNLTISIKSPAGLEKVSQSVEKLYATHRAACVQRSSSLGFATP